MSKINRYSIKESVTEQELLSYNFKKEKLKVDNENTYIMFKRICLNNETELQIQIPLDRTFDDYEDISIIDDAYCQPYFDFYNAYGKDIVKPKRLQEAIKQYNKAMDGLGFLIKKADKSII